MWHKTARRDIPGVNISIVNGVQLRPQNRAFLFQCAYYLFLLRLGLGMCGHVFQRKFCIFRSLR